MVTSRDNNGIHTVIAAPNRSATWRTNQLLILIFGCWYLLVGIGFAAAGAWVMLPLAGLEILLLAGSLYTVYRRLCRRHVVRFDGPSVRVEKGPWPRPPGTLAGEQSWALLRDNTRIAVQTPGHPWDPLQLTLVQRSTQIPVGEFLNKPESEQLLADLRGQGLTLCNYSPGETVPF